MSSPAEIAAAVDAKRAPAEGVLDHIASARRGALLALVATLVLAGCGGGGTGAGSTPASTGAGDFQIIGHWKGTLHQLGLGSFAVDAQIHSLKSSTANTVSYTVIDCSGTWAFHGMRGRSFVFGEQIDSGSGGSCKGSGTVTLTPTANGELTYSFSGEGVESRGTLSRVP